MWNMEMNHECFPACPTVMAAMTRGVDDAPDVVGLGFPIGITRLQRVLRFQMWSSVAGLACPSRVGRRINNTSLFEISLGCADWHGVDCCR